MAEKILIIGIDGGTWELVDPLIEKGELPTFEMLIKNGARSMLESTLLPVSPAAWTSFATGRNPDKHGIFDFSHRKPGTYESVPYNSRDRKFEAIWNTLGREGKKVGVLNVPATYPVEKVNGFMISGFPTPEELGDFTYPSTLLKELRAELGNDFRFQPQVNAQNEEPFLEEMHIVTDFVLHASEYLMNNNYWDFMITVFVGPDALGHVFWKYMDPAHPLYDANAPGKFKSAISDIYKKTDKNIATLMKNIDDDTTLMLMSDHGFGPLYYGVAINNWLLDEGVLNLKTAFSTRMRYWMFRMGVNYTNLFKLVKALKLTKYAAKAAYTTKSVWVDLVNKFFLTNDDIDWSRTTAYSMGNVGQLFINLKGREPQGIVEGEDNYHEVMEKVIARIGKLRDPGNNYLIFNAAYRKQDVYPLTCIEDEAPDVIFFDREMKYSVNRFFEFGSKELISPHPIWSGTHTHNGLFLAYRKDQIRKGTEIQNTTICDVAPTVLHIMGSSVPTDMDGRVLAEIFEPDSEIGKSSVKFQDREKERIRQKISALKGLGKL